MNETKRGSRVLLIVVLAVALTALSVCVDALWVHRLHTRTTSQNTSTEITTPDTLRFDKQALSFPMTVADLQSAGWEPDDSLATLVDSNQSNDSVPFLKDGCTVCFVLCNTNAARSPLSKCTVVGVSGESMDGSHTFSLENGLTYQKSTRADIEKQYGKSRYSNRSDNALILTYYNAESEPFRLTLTGGKLTQLEFAVKPVLDATAPDTLSPQAAAWEAPASLPGKIRSEIISVDGAIYRLPAPLNAFLQNGWQLSLQDSSYSAETSKLLSRSGLYPGQTITLLVTKGSSHMRVTLGNKGREMVNFASCAVTGLSIEGDSAPQFRLPGGIGNKTVPSQVLRSLKNMGVEYRKTEFSSFVSVSIRLPQPSGTNSGNSGYLSLDVAKDGMYSLDLDSYGNITWMAD